MILSTKCDAFRSRLREWATERPRGGALQCSALLVVILLGPAAVRAQPVSADPVAAEALFKAARDLIKKGDYAAGCPKFEASLALNPSASTMINIAKCHERDGKVATAWQDYHRAQVLNQETPGNARKQELEDIAAKGIQALEPRLPKLRIAISSAPAGLKVLRDGKELPAGALGEELPADPGPHEVRVSAPGHKEVTRSVILAEGKTAVVELELEHESGKGKEIGTETETETGVHAAIEKKKPQVGVPVWVWITGGAGLALAGVGVYFLGDDLGAIGDLRSNCHTSSSGTYCSPGYDYESDNMRKNRDLGVFLGLSGAGVVALGAATYGFITAPRSQPSSGPEAASAIVPWASPSGAGAMISGRF